MIRTVFNFLGDAFRLLAVGSAVTSQARKDNIAGDLNKAFRSLCALSRPVTSLLFGDDLTKVIKDIRDRHATGERLALANYRPRGFYGRGHPRGTGDRGQNRPFSTTKPLQTRGKSDSTSRSRSGARQQQGSANNNIEIVSRTPQDIPVLTFCNTPSNFYAGKVATYWANWLSLTSDAAILNSIKGIEIDFMTDYLEGSSPPKIPFSKADSLKIDLKISRLLE